MRKAARVIIFSKEVKNSIYLVYRRKNGEEYYVTPGGGLEGGESFIQAAKREALEETGVTVGNLTLIDKTDDKVRYNTYSSDYIMYKGRPRKRTS